MDAPNLNAISTERLDQVDAVLERFFSLARARAAQHGVEYEKLWGTLQANATGGKRFRPRMVMAAYAVSYGVTVGRHPVLNKPAKLIWFQDSQSMLLFKLNFR